MADITKQILAEMEDGEEWLSEGLAQALDTRVMYVGMALSKLHKAGKVSRRRIGGYTLWQKT